MYKTYGKRIFDLVLALCSIIIIIPVIIIESIIVKLKMGSPIIFEQERVGKNEQIFKLFKFRTMSNDTDNKGQLLPDSQRLGVFGRFIRSTSLDELPEIYNILVGDMSFVGPRPLLVKYLPYYNDHDRRRHEIRPGLTGLAQVSGRNGISWKEKFEKDVYYVDNVSFLLDIKIIFLTFTKVIQREGITFRKNHQTIMDYFKTSDKYDD